MSKRILIVEEQAEVAEALVARLRARGYLTTHAWVSRQALAAFEHGRPDLVVISLGLPNDGGRRLCREVRTQGLGALVPIIFLGTGAGDVCSVGEAIAVGADHYVQKPAGLSDLLEKVTMYLGAGDPEAIQTAAPLAPAPDAQTETPTEAAATLVDDVPVLPVETPAASPSVVAPPVGDDTALTGRLRLGRSVPLVERGVGEALAAVGQARLTGRLEVAAGGVMRRIFFERGRPVATDSSAQGEDLLAYMADEGQVVRAVLANARAQAQLANSSPEEVLIEGGFLQPDALYEALKSYTSERIVSLFALESGEALLVQGGARPQDPVDLGAHPGRLVLDGIRRKYGRLRLYRAFGTARTVPRVTPHTTPPVDLHLRPEEAALLQCCDGRRTVAEVAQAARLQEADALAVLYGLSTIGLIETPGEPTGAVLPALDAGLLARAGLPKTADALPGYAEIVGAKFIEARSADYHQVLGVAPGTPSAEVEAAYQGLRRRFDPHRVRRDSALWHQVTEIAAVVEDAYRVLSTPRLRTLYEHATSQRVAAPSVVGRDGSN